MSKSASALYSQNVIACIWDFDKTLIPGYMQAPIFEHYGVEGKKFWDEVNKLPQYYKQRGIRVSADTVYLNHLLTYVKRGTFKGLTNEKLKCFGAKLKFYPGLPDFFEKLKALAKSKEDYKRHGITLEHYIVSTGLGSMIRGSNIAPYVEEIYGCELIDGLLPDDMSEHHKETLVEEEEVSQIGSIVDNTIKTRFVFEINKGTNKHPTIDVNSKMSANDRRIPIKNMIYIADGPSDIPVFAVIKDHGGMAYAVYDPENAPEFAQNDKLLQCGRIHAYGEANYTDQSPTSKWIRMYVERIADRIVEEKDEALAERLTNPPKHLHKEELLTTPKGASTDEGEPTR